MPRRRATSLTGMLGSRRSGNATALSFSSSTSDRPPVRPRASCFMDPASRSSRRTTSGSPYACSRARNSARTGLAAGRMRSRCEPGRARPESARRAVGRGVGRWLRFVRIDKHEVGSITHRHVSFLDGLFQDRCLEASRCGRSTGCSSTPFARWRFTLRPAGVRIGRRRTGLCCKLGEGTARLAGMRESGIIGRHLLPNFVGDGLRDATDPYK